MFKTAIRAVIYVAIICFVLHYLDRAWSSVGQVSASIDAITHRGQ